MRGKAKCRWCDTVVSDYTEHHVFRCPGTTLTNFYAYTSDNRAHWYIASLCPHSYVFTNLPRRGGAQLLHYVILHKTADRRWMGRFEGPAVYVVREVTPMEVKRLVQRYADRDKYCDCLKPDVGVDV